MGSSTLVPVKEKPGIDLQILQAVEESIAAENFVYVHCHFMNSYSDVMIRIWKTTYLVDQASGIRSNLLHAENISFAPVWTTIPDRRQYDFLLIFSALPSTCTQFDLLEEIPQPGGFYISDISRNSQDIYHLHM